MDNNKQIEGMQKIIEDMYEKTDAITTTDIINRFAEEGYHKTVWHKVADGDLPKYAGLYLVACGEPFIPEYDVCFYENYFKDGQWGLRWATNEGRVIAWTEFEGYTE
jgi:hypothetical protein